MNDNPLDSSDNNTNQTTTTAIGNSIIIVGDVSGKEDITIHGTIEGEINFRENNIYIGESGRINANVTAKNVSVEGEVKGELRASEQVNIKPSGRVVGDIRAPRVVLDDGCQFKGSVDMEEMHTAGDGRNPKLQLAGKSPQEHPIKSAKNPGKL